jgi:hypothetical protein
MYGTPPKTANSANDDWWSHFNQPHSVGSLMSAIPIRDSTGGFLFS